jgi:formylglycine-generating enzyme
MKRSIIAAIICVTVVLPVLSLETNDGIAETKQRPATIAVKGGSFEMGSKYGAGLNLHTVTVSDFYIGSAEVTLKEFAAVMGEKSPVAAKVREMKAYANDSSPVIFINWYAAVVYCNKLSILEGRTPCYAINGQTDPAKWGDVPDNKYTGGEWDTVTCDWAADGYRLPTEAEWEYAARGGNLSKKFKYSGSNSIDDVALYKGNIPGITILKTAFVTGLKSANELGIYGMSGYAAEWCWDWYDMNYYKSSPKTDPRGPEKGQYRLRGTRGGSIETTDTFCEVSFRGTSDPQSIVAFAGIRVVRSR